MGSVIFFLVIFLFVGAGYLKSPNEVLECLLILVGFFLLFFLVLYLIGL